MEERFKKKNICRQVLRGYEGIRTSMPIQFVYVSFYPKLLIGDSIIHLPANPRASQLFWCLSLFSLKIKCFNIAFDQVLCLADSVVVINTSWMLIHGSSLCIKCCWCSICFLRNSCAWCIMYDMWRLYSII